MMDAELEEMGLINGSSTFGSDILSGTNSLVYSQDISSNVHSDDLSVYENRLAAFVGIPIHIVQDPQNIVSGYLLNNTQLPIVNRQVLVTQESLLDIAESSVQPDPSQEIITKQLLSLVPNTSDIGISFEQPTAGCESGEPTIAVLPEEPPQDIHNSSDVEPPDRVGPFVCETCGITLSTPKLYKRHRFVHLSEKPFKCKKCSESFNYESNLQLHLATHNISNPFCPECKKSFNRVASLKAHLMLHEREESMICSECGDEFSNELFLEEHMKEHNREYQQRPKIFKCLQCDTKFPSGTALRDHMRDHKTKMMKRAKKRRRGAYTCEFCSKSFQKPSQLCRHKRIHTGEKPFKCDLCPRAFNQKSSLQIHMLKHNGLRPYECQLCHSTFSQKGNLHAHVKRLHVISGDDRVYQCDQCTCVFRKRGSLNAHITRAHGILISHETILQVPEGGDQCSGSSDNPFSLKDSSDKENEGQGFTVSQKLITITNLLEDGSVRKQTIQQRRVDNVKWHQCTYCSTEFKRPSDLIRHIRIHTREKPYKCKLCFRAFAVRSTLTGHMRTHTGIKNFFCDICKNTFASASSLKSHKKSHFKEKTYPCKKCDVTFQTLAEKKAHIASEHVKKPSLELIREQQEAAAFISLDDVGITVPENVIITDDGTVIEVEGPHDSTPEKTFVADRPYKCELCGSAFKRSSHLKNHIRTHTGEKPYSCDMCDSSFGSNSALKAHMLVHNTVKEYMCSECGRGFSCQASLRRHFETHAPGHAYACPVCSKPYKSHAACSKHILSHTPDGQEKLKPLVLGKQKSKTLTVDENGMLSIVSDEAENEEDKDDKNENQTVHNDLSELIRSLQPGQHFTLTANEIGGLSVATQPLSTEVTPLAISQTSSITDEAFGEFDDRINQQLFNSLSDVQKTPLFDQGLDGCVFLQNDNLDINGTVIGANLATILPPTELQRCDQCEMSFHTDAELILHKTTHLVQKSDVHSCLACGTIFSCATKFQEHLKEGSCQIKALEEPSLNLANLLPEIEVIKRCNKCDSNFSTEEELNIHVSSTGHNTEVEDSCEICGDRFTSVSELEEHIKKHATSTNDTECTSCNKIFQNEEDLAKHILTHVSLDINPELMRLTTKRSSGKVGKKRIRRKRSIARRLTEEETKAATAMKPQSASLSERVLLQSILEKERSEKEENDIRSKPEVHPNKCKYCPKSFRKPSDLVRHLRIHTGERPFQCPSCNKCFTVKSTAASHMKTHTKDRSYKCHICAKMFATTGSLKVHMRLHTGSKPFSCPLCDARFRTSGHKKAHLMSHVKQATQDSLFKAKSEHRSMVQKFINDCQDIIGDSENASNDALELAQKNLELKDGNTDQQPTLSLEGADLEQQMNEFFSGKVTQNAPFIVEAIENEGDPDVATHYVVTFTDPVPEKNNFEDVIQESTTLKGNGTEASNSCKASTHTISLGSEENLTDKMSPNRQCKTSKKGKQNKENKSMMNVKVKIPCEVCKKSFAKEASLMKHMSKCHDPSFHCNICNEEFHRKNDLEVHMLVHALEEEWLCTICEVSYPDEETFQSHKCLGDGKQNMKPLTYTPTFDFGDLFMPSQYRNQVDVFGIPITLKSLENPD